MYIADLHIHSHYAYATSPQSTPAQLEYWAGRKGIALLGSGDCTHPGWLRELEAQLIPAEEGFYRLREENRLPQPVPAVSPPRFVLTGEVSCIYRREGRVHKVHLLLLFPSFTAARRFATTLEETGANLAGDGRPTLKLDCEVLLERLLTTVPDALCIPAHIWTPHFGVLGAASGFSSVEACFGGLTPYIPAVETGLSADPEMIRRVSGLDGFRLLSSSDAHSPQNLGREATLFAGEFSYPGLYRAITGVDSAGIVGTLEFFPQLGKYHHSGHRSCGIALEPRAALALEERCPVCGKPLTMGVAQRVEALADRPVQALPPGAPKSLHLLPLPQLVAAALGCTTAAKKAQLPTEALLTGLGPELTILLERPLAAIEAVAGAAVAHAVQRLRTGDAVLQSGYDGVYGSLSFPEIP